MVARARHLAQFALSGRGDETGGEQAVGHELAQPHRIVLVGLAAGHMLNMVSVDHQQRELVFEQGIDGLPVLAGTLHGDMGDGVLAEPVA
jgi:hypothetical protein